MGGAAKNRVKKADQHNTSLGWTRTCLGRQFLLLSSHTGEYDEI